MQSQDTGAWRPLLFLEQTSCSNSVNDRENPDVSNSRSSRCDQTHSHTDTESSEVELRQFKAALLCRLGLPFTLTSV